MCALLWWGGCVCGYCCSVLEGMVDPWKDYETHHSNCRVLGWDWLSKLLYSPAVVALRCWLAVLPLDLL